MRIFTNILLLFSFINGFCQQDSIVVFFDKNSSYMSSIELEKLKDQYMLMIAYKTKGLVNYHKKQYKVAIKNLNKSLEISRLFNNPKSIAENLIRIGDSYIENIMNPIECNQGSLLKNLIPNYSFFEVYLRYLFSHSYPYFLCKKDC